jgi:O-antigen/teichoic acid export membrane protein
MTIVSSIRRLAPKGPVFRSVLLLAGSSAVAQVVSALTAPVTTRLYTPEDYGTLAVYASIIGFLLTIAGGRYELAITVPEDDSSAFNLLVLSFAVVCFCTFLTAIAAWLFGDALLTRINASGLKPYIWLLPVSVLGDGSYAVLSYWAVRTRSFRQLAQTKMNQSVSGSVTVIGLGLCHLGPLGLLVGGFVSRSAGITTLARPIVRERRLLAPKIRLAEIKRLAVRYKQFPLLSSPSALLNAGGLMLPAIMLSAYYGAYVTGLFGLAMRIVGLPSSLVLGAISQVYLGEASRVSRDDPGALPGLFDSVTAKLIPFSLLVLLFGCLSPFAFGFVFGPEWKRAGVFAAVLSLHAAAQLVVSPISNIAILMERQDLQMVADVIRCVVVFLSFLVPHRLGYSATVAIACYAVTMLLVYAGSFIMYRRIAHSARSPRLSGSQDQ